MPRLVTVEGCGPMTCLTYGEVAAQVDRAFAGPRDEPLQVDWLFAATAGKAGPDVSPTGNSKPEPPSPEPA